MKQQNCYATSETGHSESSQYIFYARQTWKPPHSFLLKIRVEKKMNRFALQCQLLHSTKLAHRSVMASMHSSSLDLNDSKRTIEEALKSRIRL